MALSPGGLLALSASGSLGKLETFSRWRGLPYARRRVKPVQPDTLAQQDYQAIFRWVSSLWVHMGGSFRDGFTRGTVTRNEHDRLAFLQANLHALAGKTDLADLVFSRRWLRGQDATSLTVTPGAGSLTVQAHTYPLPAGWLNLLAVIWLIRDQDPRQPINWQRNIAGYIGPPFTHTFAGLTPGTLYRAGAFFYVEPTPSTFGYGASASGSGTPL